MKTPKVIVVVLNYQRPQETIECITSLKESHYSNFELLIVDNASSDNSVQKILTAFPEIHIHISDSNLGYAGGMNNGIRQAILDNPEYVMVINSDTLVARDCIRLLVEELETNPSVAATSGTIYFQSDPKKVWYAG